MKYIAYHRWCILMLLWWNITPCSNNL